MTFNGGERVRVTLGGDQMDLIVMSPQYSALIFERYPNRNGVYQGVDLVDGQCWPFSSGDVTRWQDKPKEIEK